MEQGTVKFFKPEKGYGFIKRDGHLTPADIFVHIKDVELPSQPLETGDRVEYDVAETEKGLKATAVFRL